MTDELNRAVEHLLGRASGPLHIRLWLQPAMAIFLAIRAGLKDARENKPPFLWYFVKEASKRRALIGNACKDISRLIVLAFLIDALYQFIVLKTFYPLQAVIVTLVLAFLPYIIVRGLITRIARER